jgi:hypothetical protein
MFFPLNFGGWPCSATTAAVLQQFLFFHVAGAPAGINFNVKKKKHRWSQSSRTLTVLPPLRHFLSEVRFFPRPVGSIYSLRSQGARRWTEVSPTCHWKVVGRVEGCDVQEKGTRQSPLGGCWLIGTISWQIYKIAQKPCIFSCIIWYIWCFLKIPNFSVWQHRIGRSEVVSYGVAAYIMQASGHRPVTVENNRRRKWPYWRTNATARRNVTPLTVEFFVNFLRESLLSVTQRLNL